jgi:hypothetical protein
MGSKATLDLKFAPCPTHRDEANFKSVALGAQMPNAALAIASGAG